MGKDMKRYPTEEKKQMANCRINKPNTACTHWPLGCLFFPCRPRLINLNACWRQTQIFIYPFAFNIAQTSRFLARWSLLALHSGKNLTPYLLTTARAWGSKPPG